MSSVSKRDISSLRREEFYRRWIRCGYSGLVPLTLIVFGYAYSVFAPLFAVLPTLLDSPEVVKARSVSPNGRRIATITVVGGGALCSDVYRVNLKNAGDTSSSTGDTVAQVSRRSRLEQVMWQDNEHLCVKMVEAPDVPDLWSQEKWNDVHVVVKRVPGRYLVL